jgi:hypothetical protein
MPSHHPRHPHHRRQHQHPSRRGRHTLLALLLLAGVLLAACGGGSGGKGDGNTDGGTTTTASDGSGKDDRFVAQIASYELVAGQPNRFLAALAGNGTGSIVSYGKVGLDFFYLGTKAKPVDPPQPKETGVEATFTPVAGQHLDLTTPGPKEAKPSEGIGVYQATGVTFDQPGFWGVRVKATIGGKDISANASFEVVAAPRLPAPGQPAPHTDNPIGGAAGVDPVAIDSRAQKGADIPDTALHTTSIAAAIAQHKPTVIVVSTPVYCVSRFCGPITDSVNNLANDAAYKDKVAFVHLEVWKDFEKQEVNPSAKEWITPKDGGDTKEPWVFLVGADGNVTQRFDNVVSDEDLAAAVKQLAAASS